MVSGWQLCCQTYYHYFFIIIIIFFLQCAAETNLPSLEMANGTFSSVNNFPHNMVYIESIL